MSRYAENTSVSSEKSRAEIERTLARYGATSFMYGWAEGGAILAFVMRDRQIRFALPMPARAEQQFTRTPTGRPRSAAQAELAYEQSVRQRWRALALVVKAKLEAVETGIVTFEDEFAMHMVLPDGRTVKEHVLPAIEHAYEVGAVGPLLQIGGDQS